MPTESKPTVCRLNFTFAEDTRLHISRHCYGPWHILHLGFIMQSDLVARFHRMADATISRTKPLWTIPLPLRKIESSETIRDMQFEDFAFFPRMRRHKLNGWNGCIEWNQTTCHAKCQRFPLLILTLPLVIGVASRIWQIAVKYGDFIVTRGKMLFVLIFDVYIWGAMMPSHIKNCHPCVQRKRYFRSWCNYEVMEISMSLFWPLHVQRFPQGRSRLSILSKAMV